MLEQMNESGSNAKVSDAAEADDEQLMFLGCELQDKLEGIRRSDRISYQLRPSMMNVGFTVHT